MYQKTKNDSFKKKVFSYITGLGTPLNTELHLGIFHASYGPRYYAVVRYYCSRVTATIRMKIL